MSANSLCLILFDFAGYPAKRPRPARLCSVCLLRPVLARETALPRPDRGGCGKPALLERLPLADNHADNFESGEEDGNLL